MSDMRVLVTGFEPFAGASQNPSQAVVQRLSLTGIAGVDLRCEVLPVAFGRSAKMLTALIDDVQPQVVVALGQAEGRTQITPERVAINLDDARIADNDGVLRSESRIVHDGPTAYFSTLPVKDLVTDLAADGIPAAVSTTAGTFVCNHVFYAMQHHCHGTGIASGFIHMPLMTEQLAEFPGLPTLPLTDLVRGIERAITVCVSRVGA